MKRTRILTIFLVGVVSIPLSTVAGQPPENAKPFDEIWNAIAELWNTLEHLQGQIAQEISDRIAADASLQNQIDTIELTPGPPGPEGPQGPQGEQGEQGEQGQPGDSHWQLIGSDIYYNAGNVGIGTTSPSQKLSIDGTVKSTDSTGDGIGVLGESYAGRGVVGHSWSGSGVYGFSNDGYAGDFHGVVYVEGDVKIHEIGNGIVFPDGTKLTTAPAAPGFPRPAYDSGWCQLKPETYLKLTHNIGGDINNYVVDLTKRFGAHISIEDSGLEPDVCWAALTSTSIEVYTQGDPMGITQNVRVRIWVYK